MPQLQKELSDFQTALASMWDSYSEMVRLVNEDSEKLSAPKIVIAGVLYHTAFDMMAKVGGALQLLLPDEKVDSIKVADDVASIRLSTFRATVRVDATFRQDLQTQRMEMSDNLDCLPESEREAAAIEVVHGLLPTAISLQSAFESAGKQLLLPAAV